MLLSDPTTSRMALRSCRSAASTMACISEALGLAPLGSACPPANGSQRLRVAELTGKLAVDSPPKPSRILTRRSFENAIVVLQALGGSTNAVVHLLAIAGRVQGVDLTLDDIDRIGRKTPLLVDLKPSGQNYMEDLYKAGGVPTLLRQLRPLLHLSELTVTGRTLGDELDRCPRSFPQSIVRPMTDPLALNSSIVVLHGNLAPDGCVLKASAMSPGLRRHPGPAVVFSSTEDLARRVDDPKLEVTWDSVLVLQNIGPVGHPGMPEAGYLPIPRKLAQEGVKDMVRISDGRMSGTASGAVVLHIAPESAVGGPLAIVRDGDIVSLDVDERKIELGISDKDIQSRLTEWRGETPDRRKEERRGYRRLYKERVTQADTGVDFDFLRA